MQQDWLPSAYKRVAFVSSNGGDSYMELPVTGTAYQYYALGAKIKFRAQDRNIAFFESHGAAANQFQRYGFTATAHATAIGGNTASGGMANLVGEIQEFELSTLGRTVNGTFASLPRNITQNFTSIALYTRQSYDLYSLYIQNANMTYHFIPVARIVDNIAGLYCKEIGDFYNCGNNLSYTDL